MTCISATFRTCVYLSLIKELYAFEEAYDDYEKFSSFFQEQRIRMANWVDTIFSRTGKIPAKSIEMNDKFFEVNRDNCYIALLNPRIEIPEELLSPAGAKRHLLLDYIYKDAEYYKFSLGDGQESKKKNNAAIQFPRGSKGNGMCTVSRQFMTKM
jgi:hypothetical protein